MKTLIDVDEDLLNRAMAELGTKTKKDTVNEALRFMAERAARMQALFEADPELTDEENTLLSLGIPPGINDPEIQARLARK